MFKLSPFVIFLCLIVPIIVYLTRIDTLISSIFLMIAMISSAFSGNLIFEITKNAYHKTKTRAPQDHTWTESWYILWMDDCPWSFTRCFLEPFVRFLEVEGGNERYCAHISASYSRLSHPQKNDWANQHIDRQKGNHWRDHIVPYFIFWQHVQEDSRCQSQLVSI